MKKEHDRSTEKAEKLERIPELPTELNVNISPQERDNDHEEQKKAMKFVKYTSSQDDSNNEQEENESRQNQEGNNRGDQAEVASRDANSRNRQIDREQSHSQT